MGAVAAKQPVRAATAGQAAQSPAKPLIATLALLSVMLPISINIGPLHMTPSRMLFLVLLPILLVRLFSGRYGKINGVDIMVLLYMTWRSIIPFIHNPQVALEYVGSNTTIFLGGYMAARASIRSATDFRWMARMLGGFMMFSLPFAIYETITGHMVIPGILEMIPGIGSVKDVNYLRRMGLDRVQFIFAHPILYGLFCSMGFAIYYMGMKGVVSTFRRMLGAGVILVCCFLSVSSGPLLATMVQLSLLGYAFVFRSIAGRWRILGATFALGYTVLEIASNRPAIVAILSMISFDPATANVRRILFEYGMAQIARTPILGVGFNKWDLPAYMTGSLDNFWLANAIIFGVPAFAFMFGSFMWAMITVGRRKFARDGDLFNIRMGWMCVMISISLTLATVYIWDEIATLVFFILGSGVFLLTAEDAKPGDAETPTPAPDQRRGPSFSRFAPAHARAAAQRPLPPRHRTAT